LPNVQVLGLPPVGLDRIGPLEVGQHEDVEQFGARSGAEGVETLPELLLEIVGPHIVCLSDD
jgi:hypothetical protein